MSLNQLIANRVSSPRWAIPVSVVSRLLLAAIFILAGASKIGGYAGTAQYMQSMGVPATLLPLTIALELGGGLALLLGLWTRAVAILLAGFCLVTAVIFHSHLADQMQFILFMKNLAIAGGLLQLTMHGAGAASVDRRQ